MTRRLLVAAVTALLAATSVRAASLVDPALRFRATTTEHFVIYFHQREEPLARRLAVVAETVWRQLQRSLGVRPPRRTHVVVADQTELANGFATPVPYDTVFITAVGPAPTDFIGNTDDWLRLVFTHEFTHIVHLDRSVGWARALRGVFGRTPFVFPNLFLPTWQIEGLATFEESALTGQGRLHAGNFLSIVNEAARADRFTPLDGANGGLIDWPSGNTAYAYGAGFHAYLADRYGAATFAELARATAGRVPFTASPVFKRIYGRSLGDLWTDYERSASGPGDGGGDAGIGGATATATRITHDGFAALGPRWVDPACSGCPRAIVYARRTPHAFPSLNIVSLDGSPSQPLTRRYLGSTTGVTRDAFVFDQQEIHRNVAVLSDLYTFDRRSGVVARLTSEARLLDPDVSPDGRTIVAVRDATDRKELVLVRLGSDRNPSIEPLASEAGVDFSAPRWSPDGSAVAAGRQRAGARGEVVVVDAASRTVRVVAGGGRGRAATPAWRPDGLAIVAATAVGDGPFNLVEYPLDGGEARPLTDLRGGATWPDVSSDGALLAFVGYTVDGFDVFTMPYPKPGREPFSAALNDQSAATPPGRERLPFASTGPDAPPGETAPDPVFRSAPYRPWRTLAPTSWSPVIQSDSNGVRVGAGIAAYDVLQYHAYSTSATWLASAPAGAAPVSRTDPDWQVSYQYNRWRPVLFATASVQTSFFAGPPADSGAPSPGRLREHQFETGLVVPVVHTRVSHTALASYFRSEDDFSVATRPETRTRAALRAGWSTSSAHTYGYSISPEDGITAGATAEFARTAFGADANATTLTADGRAYLPGLGPHHVLALRAAGGRSTGDAAARDVFLLGGPGPDPTTLDFGRSAISVLRGFGANTFAGSHVALVNADYRWPIAWPQRGAGTWPVFLQAVYAAAYADAGHAWTRTFRAADVKTSAGGELSVDLVAGYSLPLTATVGAAWGHDGSGLVRSGATVYFRIGHAF